MKRIHALLPPVVYLAVIFHCDFAFSQTITWQQTSGPEGGAALAMAINSHGHIFVGTDQGGVFRSTDNGESWKLVLTGMGIHSIVFNAQGHVFVTSGEYSVWRSTDNGETWTLGNKGLIASNINIGPLVINSKGHIFAANGFWPFREPGKGLFRSTDNGDSWSPIGPALAEVQITSLAVGSNDELFAGTVEGVYHSTDNGETWVQKGLQFAEVRCLLVHPNGYVFAGTSWPAQGVFRSTEHGETWTRLLDVTAISALAVNSRGEVFAAENEIFRSSDYGASWQRFNTGIPEHAYDMATNSQGHVFIAHGAGVARSTDNGEHWKEKDSGLIATGPFPYAFTPDGCMWVGGSQDLFSSCDLGESWTPFGLKICSQFLRSIVVNSKGYIFVGIAYGCDSYASDVFRSQDNGKSWTNIGLGVLSNIGILSLAINSKGHIFAGSGSFYDPTVPNQGRIFRSIDDGESWVELNTEAIHTNVHFILVNPNDDLFAATKTTTSGNIPSFGPNDGFFRSTDNGESWVKLNADFGDIRVLAMAIDHNGDIFVAVEHHGIFRSEDNGDSWQLFSNTHPNHYNIVSMAVSNGNLFAGLSDVRVFDHRYGVLWFKSDGSWTEISSGLTNPNIGSVAISPSGFLFASAISNGVFRSIEPINVVHPPAAPALAFPPNGAVNRPTTLTLHWNPYARVESYHLQVATSSDFVSSIVDDSTITTASREIGPLENSTTYYWRVQAKYAGNTSPWSEPWSFTTIIRLPDQVVLLLPPNATAIGTDMVEFKWRQSAPAVTGYWFELATDASMTNVQIDSNLTATDTTKIARVLLNSQTYWWRVRAKNLAGWGPFSELRKFQVTITISPSSVEFGEVLVGETATQGVTMTNTGIANLNVTSISLVGESANNFSVDTTPFTLAPNASKTLEVSFTPDRDGRFSSALNITTDQGDINIDLAGVGMTGFTKITTGDIVNDGGNSYGNSWGDYDNNGDLDLFVANSGGNNFLYANNGDGTFTKITSGAIVNDGGNSRASSWGDYDNDGDLDLFVANGADGDAENNFLYRNNGNGTFTKITQGAIVNDRGPSISAAWGDYDNDGDLDLFVANKAANNFLYQNNGDGTFTKITTDAVVNDGGISFTCSWVDYDDDGDLDLFVVNGNGDNNFLYRNNGDGTFAKITTSAIIVNEGGNPRGHGWGDYDNDGDLDLFVANCCGGNNFLYANNGDGTFTKITSGDIVNDGGNSHGSSWGDYDNDGDLDLFVANTSSRKNALYANNGDGTFTKITTGTIVNDNAYTFACTWSDYDNDGDLDLFDANDNENNILYRNNGNSNHRINIKCIGTVSNTSAIGAKVRVKAIIQGRAVWQFQEISAQTGWGSQNSLNAEFGLGDATVIDSLKIEWPSGIVHFFTNLETNKFVEVREDSILTGVAEPLPDIPTEYVLAQNYPNPFSQIPRFAGNPSTQIAFSIPRSGYTTLKVYNIVGREVAVLMAKKLEAGRYKVNWNTNGLPSGLYFYRLQSSNFVSTKKMILLR